MSSATDPTNSGDRELFVVSEIGKTCWQLKFEEEFLHIKQVEQCGHPIDSSLTIELRILFDVKSFVNGATSLIDYNFFVLRACYFYTTKTLKTL